MPPPSDRIILPQSAWLNSSSSAARTGTTSRCNPAISSVVAGPPAVRAGGGVGLGGLGGGVVGGEFHLDARVLGQADGGSVAILALPVEIPIGNAQQGAARAIGEDGVGVHGFADVVGVGDDADGVDIDGG